MRQRISRNSSLGTPCAGAWTGASDRAATTAMIERVRTVSLERLGKFVSGGKLCRRPPPGEVGGRARCGSDRDAWDVYRKPVFGQTMIRLHQFSTAIAAVVAGLAAIPLAAQQPERDTSTTLPTVTVTATRGQGSVLATPLAVTTVGAEDLQATRGVGLDEAMRLVPGVLAQSRYGGTDVRLVIRGFGARGAGDRSNAGTSRGIRVLVDGIPETEPDGRTSFDQIDLSATEWVEIVRSNASALWGNAAGGVVNVVTLPRVTEPRLEAAAMGGSFGLRRYTARTATLIGDGSAFLNFTNTSSDGWREHSSGRRALVNFGASGAVGDRTRVAVFGSAANNLLHIPGPLTQAQLDADPRQANPTYAARDERRRNRVGRLAATLDHQVNDAASLSSMLFVSPKVLQRSERGTFRDFNRYHIGGNVVGRVRRTFARGLRSSLSVGVDEAYQDGSIQFYSLTPEGTRGTTLRDNKREGANNAGVFAQNEMCLTRACLTIGARYDAIAYHYESFVTPDLSGSRTFSRLTPKVGFVYLFGDSYSAYASAGGGVEAPAGNETDPAGTFGQDTVYAINPLLEPIRSTTLEVGFKSMPASSEAAPVTVSYDVALYTTEVRNEIVPYQGGRFYFTAGKARRSGAELGLTALARGGASARTALTVSRNRYVTYVVDSVHYGRPGAVADYSGNRVVGVPAVIANGEIGAPLPFARMLRLKATVEHSGSYFVDDANRVRVPAYTIAGATLELREPVLRAGSFGVRGFVSVQNLFDRRYVGSAFLNPDRVAGVPVAFEPGSPRAVVVSLSVGRGR